MFRMMKVFDCQKMPEDIRRAFFKVTSEFSIGNDSAWEWHFEDDIYETAEIVQNWLLQNGATLEDKSVIIKHWW
jgi:hypothetical protein